MPFDIQEISKMSPWSLRVYKQQLRQRIKDMSPQDIESTLSRIRNIPELSDLFGEITPPTKPATSDVSLLQRAFAPFEWIEKNTVKQFTV